MEKEREGLQEGKGPGRSCREDPYGEEGHDHSQAVARVSAELPEDDILYDLADLFRIFADSNRIKILYALFEAELCVCDISKLLGLTQSAVSHQLRALKQSKLVKYRREGKTIYYSLADDHVVTILGQGTAPTAPPRWRMPSAGSPA